MKLTSIKSQTLSGRQRQTLFHLGGGGLGVGISQWNDDLSSDKLCTPSIDLIGIISPNRMFI